MRQIKIGDIVQAFWDANVIGEVVNLGTEKHSTMLVGGTMDLAPFCEVRLKSGRIVRLKLGDVFHVN